MDPPVPTEGGELQQQRGDALGETTIPCLPPAPLVLPQASTPMSQSAPAFSPGLLLVPSQPEFSHVRVHVDVFSEVFMRLVQVCVESASASVLSFPAKLVLMSFPVPTSHGYVLIILCGGLSCRENMEQLKRA